MEASTTVPVTLYVLMMKVYFNDRKITLLSIESKGQKYFKDTGLKITNL